jgi:hypothetical protein
MMYVCVVCVACGWCVWFVDDVWCLGSVCVLCVVHGV